MSVVQFDSNSSPRVREIGGFRRPEAKGRGPRAPEPGERTRERSNQQGQEFGHVVKRARSRGSDLDLDILSTQTNIVAGQVIHRGRIHDCARLDVEAPQVPGTFDLVAVDRPLAQRSTRMCAFLVNGVEGASEVEDGDPSPFDLERSASPVRYLRARGYLDKARQNLLRLPADLVEHQVDRSSRDRDF